MKNYPNECSLLYRKRADIEEFVNDNAAWEGIYEFFLSVRDMDGRHNIPAAEMLNEVCRQCARAVTDRYPENNLWEAYGYLDKWYLHSAANTFICLSLVYAVLELTSLPPKQKDFHLNSLKSILLDNDACRPYYRSALRYVHNQWIDEDRPLIIRIFRWIMSKPLLPFCEKDFLSVAEQTADGEKQKDNVAAGLEELRRQYDDCRKELESEKNRNRMLQDEIEACRAQETPAERPRQGDEGGAGRPLFAAVHDGRREETAAEAGYQVRARKHNDGERTAERHPRQWARPGRDVRVK